MPRAHFSSAALPERRGGTRPVAVISAADSGRLPLSLMIFYEQLAYRFSLLEDRLEVSYDDWFLAGGMSFQSCHIIARHAILPHHQAATFYSEGQRADHISGQKQNDRGSLSLEPMYSLNRGMWLSTKTSPCPSSQ